MKSLGHLEEKLQMFYNWKCRPLVWAPTGLSWAENPTGILRLCKNGSGMLVRYPI